MDPISLNFMPLLRVLFCSTTSSASVTVNPSKYLHFFSRLKSLVFLFCHQFHSDLSLQQLDASVAQVFTHKIFQVKPCQKQENSLSHPILPEQTSATITSREFPPYPTICNVSGQGSQGKTAQSPLTFLHTREICNEDHLSVVVQTALNILKLGPPER